MCTVYISFNKAPTGYPKQHNMYKYVIGNSPILIIGFLLSSEHILDSIVDCDRNHQFY